MTEAENLYYRSMGCGCCTETDGPEWPDIEKALRKQIAKEIENAVIETVGDSAATMAQAAAIARGKND